jgi:uncharacterized cupredoxin-like copper-binding protein
MRGPWLVAAALVFLLAGGAILTLGFALAPRASLPPAAAAGGPDPMMRGYPDGLPGWNAPAATDDPGSPGFVAGTPTSPRVVSIIATGDLRFVPDTVTVKVGETVTFEVTSMGMAEHEFQLGPAADVAADKQETPEVADIGMMETKSLTYTFSGPGPFAFACHEPGHYEAGMAGTIVMVP